MIIRRARCLSTLVPALAIAALCGSAGAQTVGPQILVDPSASGRGKSASETTASASEINPNRIITGWNDWRASPTQSNEVIRARAGLSLDGGATWTDFDIRPPVAQQSGVEGDPMTAYDDRTGDLWYGAISFSGSPGGIYVARLAYPNTTFSASVMARQASGTDKCWMAAGIRPGLPNTTRLYIAYNEGLIWSDNQGSTWTAPVPLASGIGFLPRVGPQGEVYVAYWDFGTGVRMIRSLNGGTTRTTHNIANRLDTWGTQDGSRFPGNFRVPPMNYIAVDPNNGTIYCVWFDRTNMAGSNHNVDLYMSKSVNQGTSWSAPVVIINGGTGGNGNNDQFWPWLEVDNNSRIHLTWFDGRNTVQNDSSSNVNCFFDNYYAISNDGGATWSQTRLSPSPWNGFNDGLNRSQQFLGDYNALAQAGNKAWPVYMDSRLGDPDIYTNIVTISCRTDIDGDGFVDGLDFDLFVDAYEAGQFPNGDYDRDGFIAGPDYDLYVQDFENGVCR